MKQLLLRLAASLFALCLAGQAGAVDISTCVGKFPNPLTDVCWSCMLPLSIGGITVGNIGGQEDIANPSSPICTCIVNPTVGLSVGFWEPARLVEVVRRPFCLVSLGGIDLNPGIAAPEAATYADGGGAKHSFYQAHFYMNTVLALLKVVLDFPCLEDGKLDLMYMTEVDPLWNDDELSLIINPDAVLFANPVAIAACAADCVKATTGFGFSSLFWCAGCQGGLYPLDGHSSVPLGGVRAAELLTQRLTAKLHRQMLTWAGHGSAGLCGLYLEPVMDKTAYKTQLLYPVPQTDKLSGRCCQPFGRTTQLWGAGKEYPVKGEDFSFLLFRKRNCCVGY